MGRTLALIFFGISIASVTTLTVNETHSPQTLADTTKDFFNETASANSSSRRGRHIIQDRIELPINPLTKMQVIKIPSTISKIKLVQPPLNLRHSRGPQQFKNFPPHFPYGPRWNKYSEMDDYFDLANLKKILKKSVVREVSPEEFYRNEFKDEEENRKRHSGSRVVKVKRKKAKQNYLSDYLMNHEGDNQPDDDEPKNRNENEKHPSGGYSPSASTIHMRQVAPPVLSPTYDPKLSYQLESQNFYNYIPELKVKNLSTKGRQAQAIFSQQYTTHNPHVTTNFGLNEFGQFNGIRYSGQGSTTDGNSNEFLSNVKMFSQPDVAASEQVITSLPVMTPGIKVIQPPVFRDVTVSHPSHPSRLMSSSQKPEGTTSQKATIKDILEQDCPSYESKGYCESPPRYPMHQIKAMVKMCANLMEVMNTQPFEEPDEVYRLSKRSDDYPETNATESEEQSTWARSANDGYTPCTSNLGLTEPGYAREVNSGRWFVIVQHPDTIIQRIATDICKNPGKSCKGLYNLKCSKFNMFDKSTSCTQRYTYQRLISWDPESPEGCPRMRVFKFPSACVCHLQVV